MHHHHPQLRRVGLLHKSGHTVDLQRGDLGILVSPGSRGVDAHQHQLGRAVQGFEIRTESNDVTCIGVAQARPLP